MSLSHAQSGDVIDIRPLGDAIADSKTRTLFKSDQLEVIRLVLPAGKRIAEHRAPGEITVQCLEGRVEFLAHSNTVTLTAGMMLYLTASTPHALTAVEESSLLVTLLLCKQPD